MIVIYQLLTDNPASRTANITRFSFSAFCCFFLQSLIISARFSRMLCAFLRLFALVQLQDDNNHRLFC